MDTEPLKGAVAGIAMTSPWWLPAVKMASDAAALVLPILGAVWLIVQITTKIIELRDRRGGR